MLLKLKTIYIVYVMLFFYSCIDERCSIKIQDDIEITFNLNLNNDIINIVEYTSMDGEKGKEIIFQNGAKLYCVFEISSEVKIGNQNIKTNQNINLDLALKREEEYLNWRYSNYIVFRDGSKKRIREVYGYDNFKHDFYYRTEQNIPFNYGTLKIEFEKTVKREEDISSWRSFSKSLLNSFSVKKINLMTK